VKVRVERVYGGRAMRTDVIEGDAASIPSLGMPFWVTGVGLYGPGDRYFHTSAVKEVAMEGNVFTVETANSTYKVTILEEDDATKSAS
jgi:hypothetical protein